MTVNKLVYIASPYAGDVEKNTRFAIDACRYCITQGHTPIAPHLLFTQMLDDSDPVQRETGLNLGHRLLAKVDEIWVCGDIISPGMASEIAEAAKLGIPIQQVSVEQIYGTSELKVELNKMIGMVMN